MLHVCDAYPTAKYLKHVDDVPFADSIRLLARSAAPAATRDDVEAFLSAVESAALGPARQQALKFMAPAAFAQLFAQSVATSAAAASNPSGDDDGEQRNNETVQVCVAWASACLQAKHKIPLVSIVNTFLLLKNRRPPDMLAAIGPFTKLLLRCLEIMPVEIVEATHSVSSVGLSQPQCASYVMQTVVEDNGGKKTFPNRAAVNFWGLAPWSTVKSLGELLDAANPDTPALAFVCEKLPAVNLTFFNVATFDVPGGGHKASSSSTKSGGAIAANEEVLVALPPCLATVDGKYFYGGSAKKLVVNIKVESEASRAIFDYVGVEKKKKQPLDVGADAGKRFIPLPTRPLFLGSPSSTTAAASSLSAGASSFSNNKNNNSNTSSGNSATIPSGSHLSKTALLQRERLQHEARMKASAEVPKWMEEHLHDVPDEIKAVLLKEEIADLDLFLTLTEADLTGLGLSLGQRRRLMMVEQEIRKQRAAEKERELNGTPPPPLDGEPPPLVSAAAGKGGAASGKNSATAAAQAGQHHHHQQQTPQRQHQHYYQQQQQQQQQQQPIQHEGGTVLTSPWISQRLPPVGVVKPVRPTWGSSNDDQGSGATAAPAWMRDLNAPPAVHAAAAVPAPAVYAPPSRFAAPVPAHATKQHQQHQQQHQQQQQPVAPASAASWQHQQHQQSCAPSSYPPTVTAGTPGHVADAPFDWRQTLPAPVKNEWATTTTTVTSQHDQQFQNNAAAVPQQQKPFVPASLQTDWQERQLPSLAPVPVAPSFLDPHPRPHPQQQQQCQEEIAPSALSVTAAPTPSLGAPPFTHQQQIASSTAPPKPQQQPVGPPVASFLGSDADTTLPAWMQKPVIAVPVPSAAAVAAVAPTTTTTVAAEAGVAAAHAVQDWRSPAAAQQAHHPHTEALPWMQREGVAPLLVAQQQLAPAVTGPAFLAPSFLHDTASDDSTTPAWMKTPIVPVVTAAPTPAQVPSAPPAPSFLQESFTAKPAWMQQQPQPQITPTSQLPHSKQEQQQQQQQEQDQHQSSRTAESIAAAPQIPAGPVMPSFLQESFTAKPSWMQQQQQPPIVPAFQPAQPQPQDPQTAVSPAPSIQAVVSTAATPAATHAVPGLPIVPSFLQDSISAKPAWMQQPPAPAVAPQQPLSQQQQQQESGAAGVAPAPWIRDFDWQKTSAAQQQVVSNNVPATSGANPQQPPAPSLLADPVPAPAVTVSAAAPQQQQERNVPRAAPAEPTAQQKAARAKTMQFSLAALGLGISVPPPETVAPRVQQQQQQLAAPVDKEESSSPSVATQPAAQQIAPSFLQPSSEQPKSMAAAPHQAAAATHGPSPPTASFLTPSFLDNAPANSGPLSWMQNDYKPGVLPTTAAAAAAATTQDKTPQKEQDLASANAHLSKIASAAVGPASTPLSTSSSPSSSNRPPPPKGKLNHSLLALGLGLGDLNPTPKRKEPIVNSVADFPTYQDAKKAEDASKPQPVLKPEMGAAASGAAVTTPTVSSSSAPSDGGHPVPAAVSQKTQQQPVKKQLAASLLALGLTNAK